MTGCIETTWRRELGYGRKMIAGKRWISSRYAWTREHGPIPDGMWVLHHCDNRACINVDHLYLGDIRQNTRDRHSRGRDATGDRNGSRLHPHRRPRGELMPTSRLTEAQVRAIRSAAGNTSQKAMARLYGVGATTIRRVVRGETWRSVA
jgi:hypothetical protein